ncbi:MAG: Asp-tRNA(Asn)/Glu-tRNA(Gln) amidotransferase subunit GatB [Nitrosomonas sp.]|nr:Asp-tRNA(Asn)/Glu-tRNA(Gln) amidotransferase subunit GatB [Nitrosomonas sp.]MCW5607907.1 Asp-tRNA(Asn)/Glu-tRNA(Gln) amidotransferase subunit GatB [Nitrosomonas sp.]
MQWEIVIGLEVHTQLSTQSKIFSGAATAYGAEPNTQACFVDLALPGVLPVLNRGAVERAIQFGLAINAKINSPSIFARKNYFYPDLPKGYQISQYEQPIVEGGSIGIQVGETEKTIRLTRAHLEEDAGKSLHEDFHGMSGIDLNRAGTPLLEIVSEPDLRSSAEAVAYAKTLHALVRWIGICDGNMQEGSFRCDANVSVRPLGHEKYGTRCEIKNLNSFRFLEKAIDFEVERQIEILEEGGSIRQETRLFDANKGETRTMRTKEDANDYRYFPDPDLLPVEIAPDWIEQLRASLPELPQARRERYITQYGLSAYDAGVLTSSREMADYFEAAAEQLPECAKLCANWIMGDISARLNKEGLDIADCPVGPAQVVRLIQRIQDGTISGKAAKTVFDGLWQGEHHQDVDAIIEARGLKQIADDNTLEKLIDEVLAANVQQVVDYRGGKEKAFNSLVGQVMKATKGKANPAQVNAMLREKLGG